ncbi:GNAT family N-acetyltransferase [Sphingomonas sp. MG17]|uniref:GNAT family N-acetyltransferase n=1 Tax=Sphingomonas tagetis TaxID=2949092 RepID=A0A9X2HSM6_9SPHN|nr:GNAT family N-acetyltransferase [Sphingomonas tagetis]MCP3732753.1 GNAT family N-acetyltransferase [Sphingomonas tagetis]
MIEHELTIEPLDTKRHDRRHFSSGVPQVDNYFQKTANKLTKAGNLRVYVMTTSAGDVVGFYALNAHSIHHVELPDRYARSSPGHGDIPAAYIAMIGVDARYQGQGFGGFLLSDALQRILRASEMVGISVALLDILDCGDPAKVARRRNLYLSYNFQALPDAPLRLFMPVASIALLPF